MAYENLVVIVGNLGGDPEIRCPGNWQTVANFQVATNEKWTNNDGVERQQTRIVANVIQSLGGSGAARQADSPPARSQARRQAMEEMGMREADGGEDYDDDIPF